PKQKAAAKEKMIKNMKNLKGKCKIKDQEKFLPCLDWSVKSLKFADSFVSSSSDWQKFAVSGEILVGLIFMSSMSRGQRQRKQERVRPRKTKSDSRNIPKEAN
ncbi:hypothetical protein PanWU01x14_324530, partial [Parasponia andersonii]